MMAWSPLALLLAGPAEAEARIIDYLKANVKPGQRVVVSDLYNTAFTAPEERAALNRLFNTFFQIPLYVAQYEKAAGKAPSLREIGEQFRFEIPGQTDLMLRIMESDPRMPKFLERDPQTGEILEVEAEAILAHPRLGKALERTITGWEGRPAPPLSATLYDGQPLGPQALRGRPHVVYFWFTNCPPCVKIAPLLVELHAAHADKGLEIVGLNADRVLELPFTDAERAAYAVKQKIRFPLAHLTPEVQEAYGGVSVFPTLFVVDARGTVVRHFVNFQDKPTLEQAVALALK
jgi:thiol-disulfide isomerase/thioredoxin